MFGTGWLDGLLKEDRESAQLRILDSRGAAASAIADAFIAARDLLDAQDSLRHDVDDAEAIVREVETAIDAAIDALQDHRRVLSIAGEY